MTHVSGVIAIGTQRGMRFCVVDESGNLGIGPLVTDYFFEAVTAVGQYVYAAGRNADRDPDGFAGHVIVRFDMETFLPDQSFVPAWSVIYRDTSAEHTYKEMVGVGANVAPDVTMMGVAMARGPVAGALVVLPIDVEQAVEGHTEAYLTTSWITFGLPYNKTPLDLEVFWHPHTSVDAHSITVEFQRDSELSVWELATVFDVGNGTSSGIVELNIQNVRQIRLRFTVAMAAATGVAEPPVLTGWNLRALPVVPITQRVVWPIVMSASVKLAGDEGPKRAYTTRDEFEFLNGLAAAGSLVTTVEGGRIETMKVDRVGVKPHDRGDRDRFYDGILYVQLLTIGRS